MADEEFWKDSAEAWPQHWGSQGGGFQVYGRPTAQWSRMKAAGSEDLGAAAGSSHDSP